MAAFNSLMLLRLELPWITKENKSNEVQEFLTLNSPFQP